MLGVVVQTGCRTGTGERLGSASGYLAELTGDSALATWTCTASPCPWGESLSNHAITWPADAAPIATRLGYTASPAVYLPAEHANGLTLTLEMGSAGVYAGEPQGTSHRLLATLSPGQGYEVSGLAAGEVLSVQSDGDFRYHVTAPDPGDLPDAGIPPDAGTLDAGAPPDADAGNLDAGVSPDAGMTDAGTSDAGTSTDAGVPSDAGTSTDAGIPSDAGTPNDAGASLAAQLVTWSCTGSPCPWGASVSNYALVWPADAGAISTRLGYTVSAGVYLPAAAANGAAISIDSGAASLYAGRPDDAAHRLVTTIAAGQSVDVNGLASGEVLSVQADSQFTYRVTLAGDPGGGDPDAIQSTQAFWRCNAPDCFGDDWTGAVIPWPSWAAYQNNARSGDQSRSVFAADGTPLYPYMGAWAQGCEVTAQSGTVLIIEWQRGTDTWRETWLSPTQSHVIQLIPPEDGAMIEGFDGSPGFSVTLNHCTPQPIDP